ncbi:sigma factor-like helix-turn-helix DNA-binding protein [Ectobacillus polymachus]|uniref:sigma factor-like helix-turn-helix DNA-binding protein n=1 Tax=Ectobacillus polymachus TaxID=1508806 RepID=UPI003A85E86C
MQDLIQQYRQALHQVNQAKETATEADKKVFSIMASDLQYALEWMKTAWRPGNRRGIERRAAYQRSIPADPQLLQVLISVIEQEDRDIGDWNRFLIEDAMSTLTELEKKVYIMSRVGNLSYKEVAKCLRISKSAVQIMIVRAQKKIAKQVKESLFCQFSQ